VEAALHNWTTGSTPDAGAGFVSGHEDFSESARAEDLVRLKIWCD
jgi:hypothetical protein